MCPGGGETRYDPANVIGSHTIGVLKNTNRNREVERKTNFKIGFQLIL